MEEIGALLKREEHYVCEDYFSAPPQDELVRKGGKKNGGLSSLPAPVLMNMLQECASLVTDNSATTPTAPTSPSVGSSEVVRSLSSSNDWAPPRSPSSVSHMLAQHEGQASTKTAQQSPQASQDFVYWRQQMCNWAFVVVNNFDIDTETVAVAFNLLDRYVAHEKRVPGAPTITREDYQLFAMTALYIAVKVLQPYPKKIAVEALVVMSRDFYSEEDIVQTERDMLMALGWKINTPTVMAFCRSLIESTDDKFDKEEMQRICTLLAERVVSDSFFVPIKDSMIGLACVLHASHLMGLSDDYTLQQFSPFMKLIGGHADCLLLEAILEKLEKILC